MKNRFSKLIVAAVVLLNTGFTAATLYVFLRTGGEPTALIAAWFSFTTGELWMCAGIRKAKLNNMDQGPGENPEQIAPVVTVQEGEQNSNINSGCGAEIQRDAENPQ